MLRKEPNNTRPARQYFILPVLCRLRGISKPGNHWKYSLRNEKSSSSSGLGKHTRGANKNTSTTCYVACFLLSGRKTLLDETTLDISTPFPRRRPLGFISAINLILFWHLDQFNIVRAALRLRTQSLSIKSQGKNIATIFPVTHSFYFQIKIAVGISILSPTAFRLTNDTAVFLSPLPRDLFA